MERDEIVSFRTQQARDYKAARKHYESNRSTRYYFQYQVANMML